MKNSENLIVVVAQGGLNQIYTNHTQKFTEYDQILNFILDTAEKDAVIEPEEKQNLADYFKGDFSYTESSEECSQYKLRLDNIIQKISSSLFQDFYFIEQEIFLNINTQIMLLHKTALSAFIDYSLLKQINYDSLFTVRLQDEVFLSEVKSNPKQYLIFDSNLSNLLTFHNLNTWTAYLTHYIFTTYYAEKENNPFYQLNKENLKILNNKGRFVNFSSQTFYQLRNYYKIVEEVNEEIEGNKADDSKLNEKISKLKPVRVLTFYKTHFKKGELRKSLHYTSTEKVMFIAHVGGLINEYKEEDVKIDINGEFEVILIKVSENHELSHYSEFVQKVEDFPKLHPEVMLVNSSKNIPKVMKRDSMIEFLENFANKFLPAKLDNERLLIPKTFPVSLQEVFEYDQFNSFINSKGLTLPLIIKYSGPRVDFNHLLITIITEEGLKNYIYFMKNYSKGFEDKVTMIIQAYVNHGGFVMKLYRVNNDSLVYWRPSLPDVSEELTKKHVEYSQGFFKIATSELLSKEYITLWEKISSNSSVKEKINMDYLRKVSDLFEVFSEMTLFGLDFLYDNDKNEYYLVDVNFFPGYKELVKEFNEILIAHILKYYNRFTHK